MNILPWGVSVESVTKNALFIVSRERKSNTGKISSRRLANIVQQE